MSKSILIVIVFALAAALLPRTADALTFSGYPAGKAPFDLEWHSSQDVDANGFPVNPIWAYQEKHSNQSPNFNTICGPGGYYPPNAACTSQPTEWDPQDAPFATFGECSGDPFPGHLNWDTVTDIGYIEWEGASGSWPNDNDINMRLDPYLPVTEPLTAGEASLGLEFDSTETINNFGDPFWQPGQIGSNINGDFAVASGVLGVDGVHHGGWTEIHPVLSLAILTNEQISSKTKTTETVQSTWQYFIRNSGNEGGCGSQEFTWGGRNGSWYLTLPVVGVSIFLPGNLLQVAAHSEYWTAGNNVGAPTIRGGVNQLTFGPETDGAGADDFGRRGPSPVGDRRRRRAHRALDVYAAQTIPRKARPCIPLSLKRRTGRNPTNPATFSPESPILARAAKSKPCLRRARPFRSRMQPTSAGEASHWRR